MFTRSFCVRSAVRCCGPRSALAMPLKAKITNPTFSNRSQMTTMSGDNARTPETIRELPEDEKEDVLFDSLLGLRTIELNRPKKLHSLNGSMIRKIVPRLQEWAKSDMANVVVIKATGEKAFCAGGDVAQLAKDNLEGEEGQKRSTEYFALEYKLDHLIATYKKPYVAIMDGITMGGGVGLSIHAPFRIATERTVFAMPETTIGFFPDVGASFFLPRMPGGLGTYLALTSSQVRGVQAYYTGIATHYIHSSSLPALERRLAELRFKDYMELNERLDLIDATIEEFTTGLPHDQPMTISGGSDRNRIDRCFGEEITTVDGIFQELHKLKSMKSHEAWAQKMLEILEKRSPTAVAVTFRQMALGKDWSIKETFQREHQIAAKFMRHPDFTEGVHALLIRRDKAPKWKPATHADFQAAQKESESDLVDPFFLVEGSEKLSLLTDGDYNVYPHARFGLPQESHVQYIVEQGGRSAKQVVKYFVESTKGKQGVHDVIEDILTRKTYTDKASGTLIWGPIPKVESIAEAEAT